MTQRVLGFEYTHALERYLLAEDESSLEDAYEFGRRALSAGVGVVHLAWVHHDALAVLLPRVDEARRAEKAVQASRFFAEVLAPIEMLQRGVWNSLERMRGLNSELELRADELEAAKETIERLARQRSVFLGQVSVKLSMSLDLSRTLRRIPRLAVPRLADWAALDADVSGVWTRRVAASHGAFDKRALERLGPDALALEVQRSGERTELDLQSPEALNRWSGDPTHSQTLVETGARHVMAIPLLDRHHVIGVLTLARVAERPFSDPQREEIAEFSRRATSALVNARLHRETTEAVRLRDDFLSIASHELRTPLTPMLLSLQRLLASPTIDKSDKRLVDRAITQVHRFTALVNDLLDVARIQSGKLELSREAIAFEELVRSSMNLFQASSARHRIVFEAPESAPLLVRGDRDRLEQVVTNLVDNAIKYSPDGGVIRVALQRQGSEVELSVTDQGIGIPADQVDLIFNRFFRARNASVRNFGGLGLGLHISSEIIERHGGRVAVQSEVGRGSTFQVHLPLMTED